MSVYGSSTFILLGINWTIGLYRLMFYIIIGMFSGIIFWIFYSAAFSSGTPFLCMLVCFITSMAMPPWTHPLVWSQKLSRLVHKASPVAQMVKNLLAMQETWVNLWRHGNPLQYSCMENPHVQRSLEGHSPASRVTKSDTTEGLSTHSRCTILWVSVHFSLFFSSISFGLC